MKNTFKVKFISMVKNVHCFCEMGNDWYCADVHVLLRYDPDDYEQKFELLDYCEVDKFFLNDVDGKHLILEEVGSEVKAWFMEKTNLPAGRVEVMVHCDDAVHLPVQLEF